MSSAESDGLIGYFERYGHENFVEYTPEESLLVNKFEECINCGLCLAVCEILRELMTSEDQYRGPREIGTSLSRSIPDFWATSDTIYYCTMCAACEAVCPKQVPIPEVVAMIRSKISRQLPGAVPKAHVALSDALKENGNIYGQKIEPLLHPQEHPEYVFFVGCVGTYLERESVENTLKLLDRLGVSFTTIDEVCCGGPTRVAGVPGVPSLAEQNLERILSTGTNKVITACPRCFMTLSQKPEYAGKLEVIHTTQFLARFVWSVLTDAQVTFHDPCELGRHMGEYEAPRTVLGQVTSHYVEMPGCKENTVCCGAGGGLRGVFPKLSLQASRTRVEEAIGTGSEVLVTECSSCLHNFRNARRSKDNLEIYSLSEYLNRLMDAAGG